MIKNITGTLGKPWFIFRKKAPLLSFICGRFITMLCLLFLLGFALFGLMELAPGDIVDQMMTQQIMSNMDGNSGGIGAGSGKSGKDELQEGINILIDNMIGGFELVQADLIVYSSSENSIISGK